ncbi:major capsid protein [Methylobacter sp. Wu8]|uniref:Virion coat protein B n=1 Tax=Methylobacter tundripaludum TaxID=173365 RepID=A0A2S6GPV7_9GAMM|nr:major capsid protein [Methylobacter tundripaludum]PPK67258.1 virion coat protein B [Methylobacter tundripaludum]
MNKSLKLRLAAISAGSLAMVSNAFAAVPAGVTTAISDAGSDTVAVSTAVFVVIVAIYSIKLMRKAL